MKKIAILGGTGDGLVVAEAVRRVEAANGDVTLIGFLNDAMERGTNIAGVPVLGRLEDWPALPEDIFFIPALHKVKEMTKRASRIRGLHVPHERWATIIHPTACVASDATIGVGCFVASHVTLQPGSKLGDFVSIRAGASVGHDAVLESFAYMGPNATLCGGAIVREGAHLGPNSVVLDRRTVGCFSVIGIGAAVTKSFQDFSVCIGNPARRVSSIPSHGDS